MKAVEAFAKRSLRWENAGPAVVDDQTIRVRSQSCSTECGPDDGYRIQAYETTCSATRFNNSAGQVTVLTLRNAGDAPMAGHASSGTPPARSWSRGLFSLNTSTLPGLAGQSGSITVTHDGRYGELAGKTVAVEPATGFTFDTPLLPRPR